MIRALLALPNDDSRKIVAVATLLCLVCSALVSTTAVLLQPRQELAAQENLRRNVLLAAGLLDEAQIDTDIEQLFAALEPRVVDLETGWFSDAVDPLAYDMRQAARDPALSEPLSPAEDIASIGRRPRYATVYLVRDGDRLQRLVLPVYGYGLWSTMYAFIALEGDLNTVAAINFYEQAETPGLGAEVENPRWRRLWRGKLVYDDSGAVRLRVVKGSIDPNAATAPWEVDGIAGSTLTGNGVSNMLRYWFGPDGYGPFLKNLRSRGLPQ